MKGLQDRNIHILDGTTVENKGKLNEIYRLNLNYKVRFHLIIIDVNLIFVFKGEVSSLSGQ